MLRSALAVAYAIIAASPANPVAAQLVGRWSGQTESRGVNTSMTFEFFANGTYSARVVYVSALGWSMSGSTLYIAPAITGSNGEITYGKAAPVDVKIDKDVMVQSSGRQSITMKRVTWPINESPLLGRWEGLSDNNEHVVQDFTVDGRLTVTATLAGEAGRYTTKGDHIFFEEQIPTPARKRSRYRVKEGKLLIEISRTLPPVELTKAATEASAR